MNFMIGFGSTEKQLEDKLQKQIEDYIFNAYSGSEHDYFTDEFANEVGKWIDALAYESRKQAEAHKDALNFPDRYSSFYHTVLHDTSYIAIILRFSHINRRHGMSPDGWAMMQSERIFSIDGWEARRTRGSAA